MTNELATLSIKFGGTSMGSAASIIECADIVTLKSQTYHPIVTVSAVSKITDKLVELTALLCSKNYTEAKKRITIIEKTHLNILSSILSQYSKYDIKQIWHDKFAHYIDSLYKITHSSMNGGEISNTIKAIICSTGERLSARLMQQAMEKYHNMTTTIVDGSEIIITKSSQNPHHTQHEHNKIVTDKTNTACRRKLLPFIENKQTIIVTGFIASDTHGNTTLLGRGGSDYTAALIASTMKTDLLEIWTDVNGIMSSDPKVVNHAQSFHNLNDSLMVEMAENGAKVIFPQAAELAMKQNIPLYVYNTFDRNFRGTRICTNETNAFSVVATTDIELMTIDNNSITNKLEFFSELCSIFKKYDVPIDIHSSSSDSITISYNRDTMTQDLLQELSKHGEISLLHNMSKICAIGHDIAYNNNVILNILKLCQKQNIKVQTLNISSSQNNVILLIEESDKSRAMTLIHDILQDSLL